MMSLNMQLLIILFLIQFSSGSSITAKKICFAFENDDVATVLKDITLAMFNATGIIDENDMQLEIFDTTRPQQTLDSFLKLGKTGKCGVVFTKFKQIRSNLTAVSELNEILNFYNMYAVNAVLGTLPVCYNRLIRGYLTCDSSFNYMNFYWRNYTNFILTYSDLSDMKGCITSYTQYFQTNEINTTRIINLSTATDDYWKSILDEFKDKEAILINFLPAATTKTVADYIAAGILNITMISFQEIATVDIVDFPTSRDPKYLFYIASQIVALNIENDVAFKDAYQYVIDNRPTVDPTSTETPTPTTPPPGVKIDQFTTEEKIFYELLSLYLNEVVEKKIVSPDMIISNLYNEVRTIHNVEYYLLSSNVLVGTVDGYEIIVDGGTNKLADHPFKTVPISYDIQEKELNGEPIEELCDFTVSDDYYKSTYQYIITVGYMSGVYKKLVEGIDVTLESALDRVNEEEAILGTKTLSIPINAANGPEYVMEEIKNYVEKFNVIAVLYYGLEDVLNSMIDAWTYEIPIINYSITSGEKCNKKVLEMGVNIQTLWKTTTELFDIDTIMIVYSDSVFSNNARDIVSSNAEESGIYLKEDAFIEENTVEASKNACGQILSKCTDGCYVINVLDRSYYTNFFTECYNDYNLTAAKYPIISYALDEQLLSQLDQRSTNGHYIVGYFFNSMTTTVGEELRAAVRNKNFFGPVTPNMAVLYTTVFIIARSFNKARRTDELRAFLLGARNSYYDGPGGHCYISTYGYASYLFHSGVIQDGNIIELAASKGTQIASAFYDPSEYCDWVNGELKHIDAKEVIFIYVRNKTNTERIDYFEYTADQVGGYINSKGGIAGYMVKIKIPPLNSIDELVKYMNGVNPSNVLCYVGTTSQEERKTIKDILIKQDRLLFSIHLSQGEECDENIIQLGRIPHQYVLSTFSYFSVRQSVCCIITDDSSTNVDTATYLSKVAESFSTYLCWVIHFSNFTYLEYQMTLMTQQSNSTTIYSLLGSKTNELVTNFHNWGFLPTEKYPLVILDLLYPQYYTFENKTYYENYYYISSYSLYATYKENIQMKSLIELYYGNLPMQIFTALTLISTAMGNIYIESASELRYKIYKTTANTPYGEVSIATSNLMKSHFTIHKFTNETDVLRILPDHALERSQYSALLNNNINNVCDFDEGVSVNYYENEVYSYAVWYEDEDEALYFLLREYQDITNEEGGFSGLNYDLVKASCSNEEAIEKSFNQSYRFIISGCSDEVNNKYIGKLNNTFMFIMRDQQASACNDSTVNLGLSPYQQAYPLINYVSSVYPLKAFVLMADNYNNSLIHDILVEYLSESGYETPIDLFVNESRNKDELEAELHGVLSRVLRYMPNGGVIFNYLDKYSEYIYTVLNEVICYSEEYEKKDCSDSSVYTDKYVIVTDNNEAFESIDANLRIGHLLLVSSYINNAPYIQELWTSLFGEGKAPTSIQARGILGYEIMKNILSNTLTDDYTTVRDYMLSDNNIETSYGELILDKDLHLQVIISLMTSDKEGNIIQMSKLSSYFPAETFYSTSDSTTVQNVCNFRDGITSQKLLSVLIFGPLSNDDAYIGNEMMYSFLSSFDLINNNGGIQERYVDAFVIDSTNDEVVYEMIRNMKRDYHTRIAFGCYDSFTRNGIATNLHENEIILFYPHDFEGFECKENIIYCGMPFSLRTAYIPWILSTFDKSSIAILYTDRDTDKKKMEYIKSEFNLRSVTPIAIIAVPNTGYDMKKILQLLQSKMDSGVILSLLNGDARFDIFKEMHDLSMSADAYTVVSEKIRRVDIDGEYGKYMVGHYIWVSYHKDYYPLVEERDILDKEYYYATNTTHGSENAFLAAKIFENAFTNIVFNDSDSLDVPYTFYEALDAIHNAQITESNRIVKVFTNNFMSFSISLCQIVKNETTGYLEANSIYEYQSSEVTAPNPWKTSDPNYPKLSCNWDTKAAVRGEKLKDDNYVIGAIFSVKNNVSPFELYGLNLLIAMSSKINDLGGVAGKSVVFKLFDPSAYDNDYEKVAKMAAEDDEVSVFFGCYVSACRIAFAKEFLKVNKYLFYPQTYEGQECYSSVYYFGSAPNQLFDQFVPYLQAISNYENVVLIGSSDFAPEFTDTLFEIIEYKLEDIMKVINIYRIDSNSGSGRAIVSQVIADLTSGGIILTSLIGDPLTEFLVALNEKVLSKNQIQIICYGSDREILDIDIDEYLDVYEPNYYFDEENPTNAFREAAFEYTIKNVNSAYESSVYAGMRFWYRAVLKANNLSDEAWREAIMGMEYETGSGVLKMNKNQYVSLPFYLGKVNITTKRFDIVFEQNILIEPMAWNWDMTSTHGKMCDQTIGQSKYDIEIINILFGISLTGIQQSMDTGLSNVINMLIDEFNGQGGIIGQRLYLTDIDIGSDDTECSTVLKRNLELDVNNTIKLIVTSASIDCITLILPEVKKRDIPIIHIGMSPGESCDNNILYANKEPSIVERVVSILNDVTDENTLTYSILSTYDEASSRANQYAQKVVKNLGGTIVVAKTFTSTISQQEVDVIISTILERATEGCFILLFGSDNLHKYVDKSYNNNNVDAEKYKIISYTTGESMNNPNLNPFYSIQSYFKSIESDANEVFVSKISQYTTNPITERMSSLYAIFHLWAEAVSVANSVEFSKYQQTLYTVNFDAPEGNIKIETNNYMNHYIRFGYHKQGANDFDKVYESSAPVSSNPWKTEMNDGYYICDFSSTTIGSFSRQSTKTIGILTSFSGYLSSTDRIILNGLKAAVTELNAAGGVLDKKILMQIRDCQSDLQKYIDYATELGKLDEIVAIFGGSRYSQQLAISEIAIKYDILYFYPAMSGAEFCASNTFSFGFISNQMIAAIKKYAALKFFNMIMIYDATDFSKNITKSLQHYTDEVKIASYPIFYHNLTEVLAIPESIRKSSAIIIFVSIDYVPETVNSLCDLGIYAGVGYSIFSLTMEQLHAKDISAKCLNGVKMLSTFTSDMGSTSADDVTRQESAVTFVTAMNDLYGEGSWFTQHLEAAYTSVKVWAEAAKTSYSFETDKVKSALYGLSTTTPAGSLVVNPNGFSNRVIYGFLVDGTGKTQVTSYSPQPETAQAYNQLLEGNEEYVCDFTDKGQRFKYDSIKIALFHDASSAVHEREIRILTLEEYLINDINNNKLNGYYIQPVIIFGTTAQDFIDEVHKIENDTDIVLFMGCRGDPCREAIKGEAERLNMFFIYTGISEGYTSSGNMLVTGNTAYQKIRTSVTYMLSQGVENFLLILSDSANMKKYLSTAQYILKVEQGYSKVSYITVASNRTDSSYYSSIASQISSSKTTDKRLCLLYFLDGTSSRLTLQAMKDYGINFHEIIAILIRYTRSDYSDGFLTGMPGSLITVSYSSSLTTSLSEAFVSDVQENLGNTAETLQEMEYVKVAFDIWKSAMTQAAEDSGSDIPPIEYLRSCIIGQDVKAPSGSVYVEESLHLQRNIFIMEGNANGDYLQVYPDIGQSVLIEPRPYPEGLPESAKYGKSKGLFEYNSAIVAVCYVMMAVGIVSSLFALIFTIIKRKKQVIRAFGRPYSMILAIHLIFCSLSVLTYIIPPSATNGICKARVAVIGIAFKGILGLFYAKVSKIYQKYTRSHKIIVKSRVTIGRILLFYIGFIVLGLIVVMVWFFSDIPEYDPVETTKYSSYFVDVSIRQCTVSTPLLSVELVIDGLLLLFLIYLTAKTKDAANQQNDSIGMFISTLILTLLGAVMVALDFSVSNEPDSILLLRTLGTELIIILMVLLQYGIKLVNLYLDENANLSTESGSKHMGTNGHLGTATGMHTSTSLSKIPNSSLLSQSAFLSSKMTHTHTTTLRTKQKQ